MVLTSGIRVRRIARTLLPLALAFFIVGLAAAMAQPFLALFLNTALRTDALHTTVFLIVSPLAAVAVSTVVGRISDGRTGRRRRLLIGSACCGCASALMMAFVRDYWVLLAVATTATAAYTSLLPQVFAYAREALDGSPRTAMAMSTLRTLFSIAWVAGPPLAAVFLNSGGFRLLYGVTAVIYGIMSMVAYVWLRVPAANSDHHVAPSGNDGQPDRGASTGGGGTATGSDGEAAAKRSADARSLTIWLTIVAFVALQCGGSLGVQALPLFIARDLHGNVQESGFILGLCAALEIPLMLGLGALSTRVPVRRLLLAGAACSVTYYLLVSISTSSWQLAVAQLLNASAIAAVAGLGVTYVQDMLPRRPGQASTLFSNTFPAGAILAGPVLGAAQHAGYRTAYGAAVVLAAVGFLVLLVSGGNAYRPAGGAG